MSTRRLLLGRERKLPFYGLAAGVGGASVISASMSPQEEEEPPPPPEECPPPFVDAVLDGTEEESEAGLWTVVRGDGDDATITFTADPQAFTVSYPTTSDPQTLEIEHSTLCPLCCPVVAESFVEVTVEINNLVVTFSNDDEEDLNNVVLWIEIRQSLSDGNWATILRDELTFAVSESGGFYALGGLNGDVTVNEPGSVQSGAILWGSEISVAFGITPTLVAGGTFEANLPYENFALVVS